MSLQQSYMVSSNVPGSDLTLSPLSGQSILVTGIYVSNTETGYVTIETQKSTVGYYRVDATLGNQLSPPVRRSVPDGGLVLTSANVLDWMKQHTEFAGYPVSEGETFRVTKSGWTDGANIVVEYQTFDAGDQLSTNPDGSSTDTYHVINFITVAGGVSAGGYHLFGDQITPPQFPAFPSVGDVPSNTQIKLLGIIGWSIGRTGATVGNSIATRYIKMTRERTVLFDESKQGLPNLGPYPGSVSTDRFGSGLSVFGNPSNLDDHMPFVLPVNLMFSPGDTLRVEESFATQGTPPALTADEVALGFIEQIKLTG